MINAELYVIGGKHSGQVIPLNRRKFLIGREQDCQLRPNSELVSRHHCVFSIDDYAVRLRDLGSTNGTTVNGKRIQKDVILAEGDHVVVGSLEFEFRVARTAGNDATGDDTVVASTDTMMDVNQPQSPARAADAPPIDPPQQAGSDTTVIHQNMLVPGQQPYQPYQPMGYPGQMYGQYPYQPQMPMYPQGFPAPMMPGQPMHGYPPPVAAPSPKDSPPPGGNVSLPDPSQTGAKNVPKKEPAAESAGAEKNSADTDSTNAAASIIKQYTQRRPG